MLRRRIVAAFAMLLLLSFVLPGGALAGTNTVGGVTLTTPNTYGSCTATGDTIESLKP